MSDNSGFWRAYTYEVTQVGPADAVAPAVLAQALGSQLGPGEDVTCARFVRFTGGRLSGSTARGSHVVIVTDRRVLRVTAQALRHWEDGGQLRLGGEHVAGWQTHRGWHSLPP